MLHGTASQSVSQTVTDNLHTVLAVADAPFEWMWKVQPKQLFDGVVHRLVESYQ